MKFEMEGAHIYVPDGLDQEKGLARTTHLGISAHQDDLEIISADGILKCFQRQDLWFTGIVVTNGSGSPRDDLYKNYTDEEMRVVRVKEQKKAAYIGEYAAQVFLDYPSSVVKDGCSDLPVKDLVKILKIARPRIVYTHNLADKHDTHVAVVLKVIQAIRLLPSDERPEAFYGGEVWRDLDWMVDKDKVVFDVSAHVNLQTALLGVFDSQICGGKRYDLATMGRRVAHATYFESHGTDFATGLIYGMDMTPLVKDPMLDISEFIQKYIDRFSQEVR